MAQQTQDTATFNEEGKPVDLTKRIKMIATASHPSRKEGEETMMHPNGAHSLAKRGWFTFSKAEDEKDTTHVSDAVINQPGIMTTKGTVKAAKAE